MDEILTQLRAENDEYKRTIEGAVTVIYGTLDLLGLLEADKKSIKKAFLPRDDGKKSENPLPFMLDALMDTGKLVAQADGFNPARAKAARLAMAKKMWLVDDIPSMIAKYAQYNRLPEKLLEIEEKFKAIQ